jgi:hypothetical protein
MTQQESLSQSWKTAIRRTLIVTGIATAIVSGAASDYQFTQADKAAPDSAEQIASNEKGRLGLAGVLGGVLLIAGGFKIRPPKPKP